MFRKREQRDGNSTEFQPSYLTHEMVSKPKTCSNIKTNYYSNVSQLKSKICGPFLKYFDLCKLQAFRLILARFKTQIT